MISPFSPKDKVSSSAQAVPSEGAIPSGILALLPVEPAPRRVWRRRGLGLLLAIPLEVALLILGSRWLAHHRMLSLAWLLTLDEGLMAMLLLQAVVGLALWRQRWQYWLVLVITVVGLAWLAGWPSPVLGGR